MKIRNKGSKIINIGTTILMPDASMDINEATLKLPAIQAFIAKGLLETDESDAAFQKAVEEAAPARTSSLRKRPPRRPLPQRLPTRTSKE